MNLTDSNYPRAFARELLGVSSEPTVLRCRIALGRHLERICGLLTDLQARERRERASDSNYPRPSSGAQIAVPTGELLLSGSPSRAFPILTESIGGVLP
jgi:hypothetical protein